MSLESSSARGNVNTWYGPQDLSQSEDRSLSSIGKVKEKTVVITGTDHASVSFTLPKGAIIIDSFFEVVEAFDMTATTIALGTSGSEVTNSIVDTLEADVEIIGTYQGVPAGALAAGVPLAADTTIEVAGTFASTVGKGYVSFRYRLDAR
jgi:hypothetical protein